MEIEGFKFYIPTDYKKIPLPFFNEWLAALEAGLPQTTGTLKDDRGYCCLGVLCQVQNRLSKIEMPGDPALNKTNPCFDILNAGGIFSRDIQCQKDELSYDRLAALNDAEMSFKGIAELIRLLYKPQ